MNTVPDRANDSSRAAQLAGTPYQSPFSGTRGATYHQPNGKDNFAGVDTSVTNEEMKFRGL